MFSLFPVVFVLVWVILGTVLNEPIIFSAGRTRIGAGSSYLRITYFNYSYPRWELYDPKTYYVTDKKMGVQWSFEILPSTGRKYESYELLISWVLILVLATGISASLFW